jgi:maltose phosphorylase
MLCKFQADEWKIVEDNFDPATQRLSESIFSLGNEHMGLRGFFEEEYTGDTLPGIYVAGVYYPDKTRVGWWKVGYPEYFAKVINSTNWLGINIQIDGETLDLNQCSIKNYHRELDMRVGLLTRSFVWLGQHGNETEVHFSRFLSMAEPNLAVVTVTLKPLNYNGECMLLPYINGDVSNEDANYGEKFWTEENRSFEDDEAILTMRTKKTNFLLSTAMGIELESESGEEEAEKEEVSQEKYLAYRITAHLHQGHSLILRKFVAVATSRDYAESELEAVTLERLRGAFHRGYDSVFANHSRVMEAKWAESDVTIEGDVLAQQGIRYNIFQLNQTYSGKDPRLNIGPKGFSGEKYGGVTYWDTEAFCFPFYLLTNEKVARNLLYYRYLHLERAKENAAKLGMKGALFPMVTINGEECHNEWEITFEEIHRNAAITYAIYNYTRYTNDFTYLFEYGLDVLVETSRYWADRVTYNPRKDRYMILGVTGPNEYENNVNNNWYTNTMASWNLEYTLSSLQRLQEADPERYEATEKRLHIEATEMERWTEIIQKMYRPYLEDLGVFEQNDLYIDKCQQTVDDISCEDLPLFKHWSWDRILRSCFIKQADVIQGIYFHPERFDRETMQRNFDFYEPRTVHESSLSASIYSIVASWIGRREKAYELYLRTARLDLDNYNDDSDDGIHLTSMAGTWSTIIQGFAGVRVIDDRLALHPYLPGLWRSYSFQISFRGRKLRITVTQGEVRVKLDAGEPLDILVYGKNYKVNTDHEAIIGLG